MKLHVIDVNGCALTEYGAGPSFVTCKARSVDRDTTLEWTCPTEEAPRVGDPVHITVSFGMEGE